MKRPTGIIVCVALFLLGGLGALFMAALALVSSSVIGGFPGLPGSGRGWLPPGVTITKGVLGLFGLVALLFAGLDFFVAWGIYQLKNWARIAGIILAVLTLFRIPVGTILGLIILYFLVLDKDTVAAFK